MPRLVDAGEMPVKIGVGLRRVTTLEAVFDASAALVALTFTVFGEGRVAGAVYFPVASIIPSADEPPAVPFTDQVTPVLEEPITVAENV